jgi:hypothetical protein
LARIDATPRDGWPMRIDTTSAQNHPENTGESEPMRIDATGSESAPGWIRTSDRRIRRVSGDPLCGTAAPGGFPIRAALLGTPSSSSAPFCLATTQRRHGRGIVASSRHRAGEALPSRWAGPSTDGRRALASQRGIVFGVWAHLCQRLAGRSPSRWRMKTRPVFTGRVVCYANPAAHPRFLCRQRPTFFRLPTRAASPWDFP